MVDSIVEEQTFSYSVHMRKINFAFLLFLMALLAVFIVGCSKSKKNDIENAVLLEPTAVSDQDMVSLQSVKNFPEPNRRVALLLGYGYNEEDFVKTTMEKLKSAFGMAQDGGALVCYVFPDDFGRGSSARISLLPGMLKEDEVSALVLVGAPEGTHRALASLQDSSGGSIGYPVISLLPQDDVLGMEAACDLVMDYLPSAAKEEDHKEESEIVIDNVLSLIERAVYYASIIPLDVTEGFDKSLRDLTLHAKLLAGTEWNVSQYIDPETGIRPQNHFVIEYANQVKENK